MLVVIRGAGDIATGIALRLYRCGFRLVLCEVSQPPTSAAQSASPRRCGWDGRPWRVWRPAARLWRRSRAAGGRDHPRAGGPRRRLRAGSGPRRCGRRHPGQAESGHHPGHGPGGGGGRSRLTAGVDCHAAVETMRGHTLGRVIYQGSPLENTGRPGTHRRLCRGAGPPCPGGRRVNTRSSGWWRPGT